MLRCYIICFRFNFLYKSTYLNMMTNFPLHFQLLFNNIYNKLIFNCSNVVWFVCIYSITKRTPAHLFNKSEGSYLFIIINLELRHNYQQLHSIYMEYSIKRVQINIYNDYKEVPINGKKTQIWNRTLLLRITKHMHFLKISLKFLWAFLIILVICNLFQATVVSVCLLIHILKRQ